MAEQKKSTSEEEVTPEDKRKTAIANLNSSTLTDLASAYFVEENKQYGEAGNSAIEKFKYMPALMSEEGSKLVMGSLMSSKQGTRRYSENVNAYQLISNAASIIQESLMNLQVSDITSDKKYSGNISELDDEAKGELIGMYQNYLTDKKVSEAFALRAEAIKEQGKLEDIVGGAKNSGK